MYIQKYFMCMALMPVILFTADQPIDNSGKDAVPSPKLIAGKLGPDIPIITIENKLSVPIEVRMISKGRQAIIVKTGSKKNAAEAIAWADWKYRTKWKTIPSSRTIEIKVPIYYDLQGAKSVKQVGYLYEDNFLRVRMFDQEKRAEIKNAKLAIKKGHDEIRYGLANLAVDVDNNDFTLISVQKW